MAASARAGFSLLTIDGDTLHTSICVDCRHVEQFGRSLASCKDCGRFEDRKDQDESDISQAEAVKLRASASACQREPKAWQRLWSKAQVRAPVVYLSFRCKSSEAEGWL